MNAIDQAFIRAYEADEPTSAPPVMKRAAYQQAAVESAPHFRSYAETPALPVHRGASPSERRPLSAFARTIHTAEAHFKPALEVDQFRWSTACEKLLADHRERLRPALMTLMAADEAGRSLIGVGAPVADMGATTILTCLARLLVDAGKTVAMVDGNFASPALARQLGLIVDQGWEDVLAGNMQLAESVVYSLADRISLLPLVCGGPQAVQMLESIHSSVTAGVLRFHYDIVLFDLGAIGAPAQTATVRRLARQCRLDGAVLVSGGTPSSMVDLQRLTQLAPEIASICLGVIENQQRVA